jgi:hypothetical protein
MLDHSDFGFWEVSMDHFIHRENIAHYKRLLAEADVTTNQVRHRELTRLLAAEIAKDSVAPLSK